jgi:formate/nitrite transporter
MLRHLLRSPLSLKKLGRPRKPLLFAKAFCSKDSGKLTIAESSELKEQPFVVEVPHSPDPSWTPAQIFSKLSLFGLSRGDRPSSTILVSSVLAGAYLSIGGWFMLKIGGTSPEVIQHFPGIHSLLCGIVFPVGLSMIILTGSDLLTSNMMYSTLPLLTHPKERSKELLGQYGKLLSLNFVGNFAGSVVMAYLASFFLVAQPSVSLAVGIAVAKTSLPFGVALVKGILANWLVNVAIYLSSSTQSTVGRLISLWIPITIFVTLGLEHCVANMFLIPFAMFVGAPITWSQFLVDNLFPVVIGNFIGASFFISYCGWFVHLRHVNKKSALKK